MAGEDVVDADVTPDQSKASNGKSLNSELVGEENLREESRETGLKALPAEEKARIGQLIKLLAQERRDKNTYRQKLDEQAARLQTLEQERERCDKETYRQKVDEQNARLQTLEKECELGAQERKDKEAYRQKVDEQNARLQTLEQECALGRQQEQELLSRVSRSLHLLRSYQRELKVTKEAAKCEDTKLKENEQSTALVRLEADRVASNEPNPHQIGATEPDNNSRCGNPVATRKVQASVQTKPWHGDIDETVEGGWDNMQTSRHTTPMNKVDTPMNKQPLTHARSQLAEAGKVQASVQTKPWRGDIDETVEGAWDNMQTSLHTTPMNKVDRPMNKQPLAHARSEAGKLQASVQTKPWRGDIDETVEGGWDNMQTNLHTTHMNKVDRPMSKQPLAHAHNHTAPSAFRHVISQFQSPRPPLEPMQCLSPLPRAAMSRSTSLIVTQNHLVTQSLEPLMQSPLPSCPSGNLVGRRRSSTPDQSPKRRPEPLEESIWYHSPKPQQEPSMQPLWPLPRGATSRSSSHMGPQHHEMVTHSLEPLLQSPLPRKTISRLSTPERSPKRRPEPLAKPVWYQSQKQRQESSMQPLCPSPRDATNSAFDTSRGGSQQHHMAHSLANSPKTCRVSWPVLIQDGYYPPSMFDVLDSVESALSEGSTSLSQASSSNSKTASFGRSSSELARLQQEITDLELRVFGTSIATPGATGYVNGIGFDNFSDMSASQEAMAALRGAPMSDKGTFLTVPAKREGLARGKSKV